MKPFRGEFVDVRERRYHVRVWGEDDAPTLFCLHGWGDVGASFQFVVDALRGDWRVVAPDWRGFGLTQWNQGAYWFADYLADLDGLLERYSPEQPARLVGHSMGGIVASLYAGVRPGRVARFANLEGFVLWVSPPGETTDRLDRWLRQIRDDSDAFRPYARRVEFADRLVRDNPRLTPERAAFLADHSLIMNDDGHFVFAGDPHHRWISPQLFPIEEAKACWRRIAAPTLWVAGRDSAVIKKQLSDPDEYRARRDCFARRREVVIDDCGHNIHHDQPQRLAGLLDEFFA